MTDVAERVKTYQQFIGGEWVDSASGETLDVENPADGTVIAQVQASNAEDVDRAANAAATAFETWQHTHPGRAQPACCSSSPTGSRRAPTSSVASSRRTRASRSAPRSTRSRSWSTTCASSPVARG